MDADDPMFDASMMDVDVDSDFVDEVRSWLPDPGEIDPDDVYWGDGVGWVGIQGRMMKLPWDQIQAFPGNPFDERKTAAFRDIIRSGERPLIYAPPAMASRISLDDVRESQEAEARGELFDTHGMTRPLTSGDDELDEFLADEEDYLETYAADEDDEAAIRAQMTLTAEKAIADNDGDLGKLVVHLRDGNHRAFGAQLAGEDEVWVTVRFTDEESDMAFLGLREDDFE